jgi:hypothetical protein
MKEVDKDAISWAPMPVPDREQLRLHALTVQGQFAYPMKPNQLPVTIPPALSAKHASEIYGELARFGFATFQQVPGGAQLISADGQTTIVVTATQWAFGQMMTASPGFRPALDQLGVALRELLQRLEPDLWIVNQFVDIQALWPLGSSAEDYIARRFLTRSAIDLAEGLGLRFNGGAIRLNLDRPTEVPVPPGLEGAVVKPVEEFDVRIEPFFQDKNQLFLQVQARLAVPTREVGVVLKRVEYAHRLLWEEVPARLTFRD